MEPMRELPPIHRVPLGQAWAANSLNTCIYRGNGLVSRGRWQFAAWYADRATLRLLRRDLADGTTSTWDLPGTYNVDDAHNNISLGVDPAGFLHLSYDHHVDRLRYRRSLAPLAIDAWSEPLAMTGQREAAVTYPVFLGLPAAPADREGRGGLLFLYRDGCSGDGDLCAKLYDAASGQWRDAAMPLVQGRGQQPFATNPYWDRVVVDAGGEVRLSYTWRLNNLVGQDGRWFNRDVCHLRWRPGASDWRTTAGDALPLPATPTTAETIWPVAPFRELINTNSAALDAQGRMHVVHWGADAAGVPQYWHLRQTADGWRRTCISRRTEPFQLAGPGFLRLPIGRPEIVIDDHDRVHVIQRGDHTGDRMAVQRLDPPDYAPPGIWRVLAPENLGHCEPVLDPVRWQRDRVLSLYLQYNAQPQFDRPTPHPTAPAWIGEWDLAGMAD